MRQGPGTRRNLNSNISFKDGGLNESSVYYTKGKKKAIAPKLTQIDPEVLITHNKKTINEYNEIAKTYVEKEKHVVQRKAQKPVHVKDAFKGSGRLW